MECPNCRKVIPKNDSFCAYCGADVRSKTLFPPALFGIAGIVILLGAGGLVAVFALLTASTPTPTPPVVAQATSPVPTRPPAASATVPPPTTIATATAGAAGKTTAAPAPTSAPTSSPMPTATPIIIIVTPTYTPSPTPMATFTPTPTPTPWFGFVSLRWEPASPHWGDDVVFYAKFNNTKSDEGYLYWRIEVCKAECTNWRSLMFQTYAKEDKVPAGGMFEVVSSPAWPLRGQGGTQTFPVRFVHVTSDDTRTGEQPFYVTVTAR